MDRLEYIRSKVDRIIEQGNTNEIKYAFIHLYTVSNCATLLAKKRNLDSELCAIIAMLHDISFYQTAIRKDHAFHSANQAKKILNQSNMFHENEIEIITQAILFHSEKAKKHGPYEELIKDSEVLSQYLYNPKDSISEKNNIRLYCILKELNIE